MRATIAILVLVAAASAVTMQDFRAWSRKHNKVYTEAEVPRRFEAFRTNAAEIARMNSLSTSAHFALNKFSDLTNAEFAAHYTTKLLYDTPVEKTIAEPDTSSLWRTANDSVDYRSYLPAVKDQAQCGSCWAFSAVANMEGQTYQKNGGSVVSLSEQQLVSCNYYLNLGCYGGNPYFADLYAIEKGMTTEEEYPYESGNGTMYKCHSHTVHATFKHAHQWIALKDETLIQKLLKFGPVVVAIEADKPCFQSYAGGVLDKDECACGVMVNHGVTLVGYGTDEASGKPYWLVRNSWGSNWGDNGYVKIVRGKDLCQINQRPGSIEA